VVPRSDPAWLFTIARNVVLHRRRTLARRARNELPAELAAVQAAASAVSETAPELFGLTDALARLTEPQRRAIVLREWAGLSYREIASELDLSVSAVETLIFRARRTLTDRVQPSAPQCRRSLGLWLPGAGKSLLSGAAVKVATGAASVAVIVAAGAPLVSHRGPAAGSGPAIAGGPAPIATSRRSSFRPAAGGPPLATHGAVVLQRQKPTSVAAEAATATWTVPTVEADPPATVPEPAASAAPPTPATPVTADPAPAPMPDVPTAAAQGAPSQSEAAPQASGTSDSTTPTPAPPTQPGPPPVAAAPEGAGPPAALLPTLAGPGSPTLPDAAAVGRTLQEHG
jgi:Sigma-70, region 4